MGRIIPRGSGRARITRSDPRHLKISWPDPTQPGRFFYYRGLGHDMTREMPCHGIKKRVSNQHLLL